MEFFPLTIAGAKLVRLERHNDERGFFARTFCVNEFAAQGLPTAALQSSVSYNHRCGTVRGMHFQWPPSREGKLVRCLRGAIVDVLLDLRPGSATYMQHCVVMLDEDNHDAVFIPPGLAHGFQTLADKTEILYQMTDFYVAELQTGFRWNDPAFAIRWSIVDDIVISQRDATYPNFDREQYEAEWRRRVGAAP